MIREKLCHKCGNPIKDGDLFCEKCGTKIESSKTDLVNRLDHDKINHYRFVLGGVAVFLILLVIVAVASSGFDDHSVVKTDGVVQNVTEIALDIHDVEGYFNNEYSNDSSYKNNEYYSSGDLKFDVLTNGSIYNVTTIVKFYNGNKSVFSYKDTSNNKLNPGINHESMSLSNEDSNSALPQKNETITDIIITLEGNVEGANTKLFETPKVNVGSFNLRYYEALNPNYLTPSPQVAESTEPDDDSEKSESSPVPTDTSGNFGNGYKYCYSSSSKVYHTKKCGHLPQPENRIYSNSIPSNRRLCEFCA
ncbi:MAG: zinc ribbon domain-containing protein [Methanobrevibacter sp.]|nr:zinc ribbon domain-containing protein [Candidatus Methanovirga meridionalis]